MKKYWLVTTGLYVTTHSIRPEAPGPCVFNTSAVDRDPADYLRELIEAHERNRREFPESLTRQEWLLIHAHEITEDQYRWWEAQDRAR